MEKPLAETYHYADFTESSYREILRVAKLRYAFEPFGTSSEMPHVLWRHDVDFSVHRAVKLAQIEAEEGVAATYFLQLGSPFYNLLEPSVLSRARRIADLGHRIGLHFDMAAYVSPDSEHELERILGSERRILAEITGAAVESFSFHNPGLTGAESVRHEVVAGMINAYAPSIKGRYSYISDSNGYWQERRLPDVVLAANEERLHVLTHPEWWSPEPMSPKQRLERCVQGRTAHAVECYEGSARAAGRLIIG